MRPASSRLPKNFQPVGVSKHGMPSLAATRLTASLVAAPLPLTEEFAQRELTLPLHLWSTSKKS
jgi:hypothetical protein